jgi:predicted adenylyl cyclase CyaB
MDEIEVKILEIDKETTIQKLQNLGAQKRFEGELHAVYLDFPDKRLKKKKSLLRLRKEGDQTMLTFKKKQDSSFAKSSAETEVTTTDFDKTLSILKNLGLEEIGEMKKKRVSYSLGNTHFEFDKPEHKNVNIPWFMEIEAQSEEELKKYLHILDIAESKALPWTGKQVLEHYEPLKSK